jgi:putative hydrolase
MKLAADLHVHSIGSGHAYSTIVEILQAAAEKGLEMVAVTDHGPAMPDGPHPYYFGNQRIWPEKMFGVTLLKGVEANIIDETGRLDLNEYYLKKMDVVLAGLHVACYPVADRDKYTRAMISAIKNPYVDIIVHPGNPDFPLDYETVVQTAAEYVVAMEINNSSLCGSRSGSDKNCAYIAKLLAHSGAPVTVGSDAHFACDVGRFDYALELLLRAGVQESQIINTSVERIRRYLASRRRARGE